MKKLSIPKFLKKKHICPICMAKKMKSATQIHINGAKRFSNGAALTPPMGWASWNLFRHNINENIILEIAKAIHDTGLGELGYQYVNIDDCWMSSSRDEKGRLQGDLTNFPSGIKSLCNNINSYGLKMGIYTSNGTLTCEDLPASLYHERTDAETFAEWGIEYFKYDFCHNEEIPTSAPEIEKLMISPKGSSGCDTYYAADAELRGNAEVFESSKLTDSGKYVGGLDADGGKIIFRNIKAETDGEYILTLGLRKFGKYEKYADITVNETDIYPVRIPPTDAFSPEGRHQITVRLRAGNNSVMIHNPIGSKMDSAARQYTDMGKELQRATKLAAEKNGSPEKPICYSICEWGRNMPWKWGHTAGNLWRTTGDIRANWVSMIGIYEVNVRLHKYAGPGNWNDPDMLEVGNGELTVDENRAHFSLWCMMAAPLILGNDIRKFIKEDGTVDENNSVYKIISNKEAIAIDQDKLGIQCRRISSTGLTDILVKPLVNNEIAVCLLNKGEKTAQMSFDLSSLRNETFVNLPDADEYIIKDIWDNTETKSSGTVSCAVKRHSVKLFRIKAKI